MLNLVARVVAHICEAEDREQLYGALQSGLLNLGFATFNLSCRKQSTLQFMTDPTLTSMSDEDLIHYVSERWYERDPLLDYTARPGKPKIWSPQDWLNCDQFGEFAEYLASLAIQGGVTAPLSHKPGAISAITALSFSKSNFTPETATAVYVIGQTAALRAVALGLTNTNSSSLATLSIQQLEILEWMKQGKSNGDIALITNRSKRLVAYHVSEILRKLGVTSRAQAIAIYASE
ncbi:LuxR family transcriptional regulator [Aminobacter sp. AP02]|uniref:helix-turn-helix transcriptional regulator n=1 Tax=Aminobacter sp. AP02 TaxID=2135737 RepID=UPI000D78E3A9|nr:LuxR family transcriptional regulator [Aminobacter sp. AP02]PWK73959.1 LuxR family transcriptional regulator [Aminobacter sp. AP02]